MLLDRGYDLVGCIDGSCLSSCKKGETLGPEDVDDCLSRFTLYATPKMSCVMEARVPENPDRASFIRHLKEGSSLRVYFTNDHSNLGKNIILDIIQEALDNDVSRVIIPLAQSYTSHTTKEIANAKAEHGIDVEIFAYNELYAPLASHELSPTYRVLSPKEVDEHLKTYDLTDIFRLPKMEDSDPQARYYGLEVGLVVEVHRPSLYYRVIIPSVA